MATKRKAVKKAAKRAPKGKSTKKVSKRVSARKSAKKASPKRRSSLKRKASPKKKAVKKAPAKKPAGRKRSASKKPAKRVKDRLINVCAACESPRLRNDIVDGQLIYSCLRCGYRSPNAKRMMLSEVRKSIDARRGQLRRHHLTARHHRQVRAHALRASFHMRMWFRLLSLLLLVLGIILLTSDDVTLGIILTVIGVVGVYTAEKF